MEQPHEAEVSLQLRGGPMVLHAPSRSEVPEPRGLVGALQKDRQEPGWDEAVSTIDFDMLASYVKTRKVTAVAAWCARNRVLTFRDAKGRPCTTVEALNRALYRGKNNENEPDYEWESSPADSPSRLSSRKTGAITRLSETNGSDFPGSMRVSKRFTGHFSSSTPHALGRSAK